MTTTSLTTRQAAIHLGYAASTLKRWRRQGRGPAYVQPHDGGPVRYLLRDLIAWQRRHRRPRARSFNRGTR
jgi:hypothetical protein